MRVSLVYPLLLALPPGIALGVGTVVLTGSTGTGLTAGVSVSLGLFLLILVGTEFGSTDREPQPGRE
ncbi:hypothetical protein SAMN05443574_10910 [Haloarcula vallismortis]|uniref:Uncharacterized protein n=2 Tax=Haloarcula vallismortis TaxID=28442 RepID=M0JQN0_HALVA|nr:hypothetical protein [Haloarcula vallismortis]EMA10294.1 hypothetical protein C437_03286 [Haloarcula vallismortis ATCC 29715]SDW89174.1 hypothetical protein SAMN05443574_10910 [Haloarcula vallismortis]